MNDDPQGRDEREKSDDLPSLELEITSIKERVDRVERKVAWLKQSMKLQARGRYPAPNLQGDADAR